MKPDDAFLRAIIENPDDDTPRLVYADWLEEAGQGERAEFIRVQVELDQLRDNTWGRRRLEMRASELLVSRGAEWLAQAWPEASGQGAGPGTFRRGFVAELDLRGRSVTDEQLLRLARPSMLLLHGLDLTGNAVTDEGLRAFAASPYLHRLAFLNLCGSPWSRWAGTEWPDGLAILDFLGGQAPVRAYGSVGRAWFYFRARGDTWTFAISEDPKLDPSDVDATSERTFHWKDHYGEGADGASYMPLDEAQRIIRRCTEDYRRRKGWTT